jgi:hypothetical protein
MFTCGQDEYTLRQLRLCESHMSTQLMTRRRICSVAIALCINRCVSLTYIYQIYVAYSRHFVPDKHGTWCSLLISNVVLDNTPLILE